MALTKEEKELVEIGSEIERLQKLKGFKLVKSVLDAMYIDTLGGIDSNGNLIDGAIDDLKVDFRYVLGYRKALVDFWRRAVAAPIKQKNMLLEMLREEEKLDKRGHVNRFEESDDALPNM